MRFPSVSLMVAPRFLAPLRGSQVLPRATEAAAGVSLLARPGAWQPGGGGGHQRAAGEEKLEMRPKNTNPFKSKKRFGDPV